MPVRVLVVGSYVAGDEKEFAAACRGIGEELARAHCHVILGSTRETTADYHVMIGMRQVIGTHRITIVRPLNDIERALGEIQIVAKSSKAAKEIVNHHPDTKEDKAPKGGADNSHDSLPGSEILPPGFLNIDYIPVRGPWGVGRITQLLRADVVIAIGGNEGTMNVIQAAPELKRPVVLIPSFDGSAKEAWYRSLHDSQGMSVDKQDPFSLANRWDDMHAADVVGRAIRLAQHNPYADNVWRSYLRVSLGVLLLIVLWAFLFSYPCSSWLGSSPCSNNRPTIFLLFWLSAFIGTGLRAAKRLSDNPTEQSSTSVIFIEGAIGLSVAFGLSLLYMAGLFLTSTSTDVFPLLAEAPNNSASGEFRRTAVLMSSISFASSFLLEGSFKRLQDKLRERLLDES